MTADAVEAMAAALRNDGRPADDRNWPSACHSVKESWRAIARTALAGLTGAGYAVVKLPATNRAGEYQRGWQVPVGTFDPICVVENDPAGIYVSIEDHLTTEQAREVAAALLSAANAAEVGQ